MAFPFTGIIRCGSLMDRRQHESLSAPNNIWLIANYVKRYIWDHNQSKKELTKVTKNVTKQLIKYHLLHLEKSLSWQKEILRLDPRNAYKSEYNPVALKLLVTGFFFLIIARNPLMKLGIVGRGGGKTRHIS